MNHEYTIEILYHLTCSRCKGWWSHAHTPNMNIDDDEFTYSLLAKPTGMEINVENTPGLISWTPSSNDTTSTVVVEVADGMEYNVSPAIQNYMIFM